MTQSICECVACDARNGCCDHETVALTILRMLASGWDYDAFYARLCFVHRRHMDDANKNAAATDEPRQK